MNLTPDICHSITETLLYDFMGKMDGSRKNILFEHCPFCGHGGYKFGVYVGPEVGRKHFGGSNCFHCNNGSRTLKGTLKALGREDLMPKETADLSDSLEDITAMFDDDIDDSLVTIDMPTGYKRCFRNQYLKSRGWNADDFEYFPVGTNRNFDRNLSDYIILEVIDDGRRVGYVARSIYSKEDIEEYNRHHRFPLRRYKNSNESEGNGFSKMLYNYDAIIPYETVTVVLCEGPFDVVALNRKLEWYDNHAIVPVATFGKKISDAQIYKLQKKGVSQVVIGYDNDAKETTSRIAMSLENYFDVLIADIPDGIGKDWDEMDSEDIYDVFCYNLKTVREFNLT